jgi:hypothetical protein
VYILIIEIPVETTRLDFGRYRGHALLDGRQVGGADNALSCQHAGMRQRGPDVLPPHAAIKEDGSGVAFDQGGYGFGKAAGPGSLEFWRCRLFRFCHNRVAMSVGNACGKNTGKS